MEVRGAWIPPPTRRLHVGAVVEDPSARRHLREVVSPLLAPRAADGAIGDVAEFVTNQSPHALLRRERLPQEAHLACIGEALREVSLCASPAPEARGVDDREVRPPYAP